MGNELLNCERCDGTQPNGTYRKAEIARSLHLCLDCYKDFNIRRQQAEKYGVRIRHACVGRQTVTTLKRLEGLFDKIIPMMQDIDDLMISTAGNVIAAIDTTERINALQTTLNTLGEGMITKEEKLRRNVQKLAKRILCAKNA